MKNINKKTFIFIGIIATLSLAILFALGTLAINNANAVDSPQTDVISANGFTIRISNVNPPVHQSHLNMRSTDQIASNVPESEKSTIAANFEVYDKSGDGDGVETITFDVGYNLASAVAGQPYKIYIQHDFKPAEVIEGIWSNSGTATITPNGLSIYSISTVLKDVPGTNNDSVSPKTGLF